MADDATAEPIRRRAGRPAVMRTVRDVHLYLGMLIAPSLIFFAATGALQVFGLHEIKAGRDWQPPALIQKLGEVHKNQRFALKPPRRRPPAPMSAKEGPPTRERARPTPLNTLALKWFFLVVALGLIVSTGLGVWIAVTQGRRRRLAWGLLIAGTLVPVLLAAL